MLRDLTWDEKDMIDETFLDKLVEEAVKEPAALAELLGTLTEDWSTAQKVSALGLSREDVCEELGFNPYEED